MNNNTKTGKLIAILLLVAMVSLVLLSGTYAKYTSSASGDDTAVVAKWAIKLNGEALSDKISFDLFSESGVYDLADLTDAELADLSTATKTIDTDVATGAKVAPGTWGKVAFEVTNESDVSAEFSINVTALTTTLPLQFSVDGSNWVEASKITTPYNLGGEKLEVGSTTAQTSQVSLYWKWDFEDGTTETDEADTQLGSTGTATCAITANMTATQVD